MAHSIGTSHPVTRFGDIDTDERDYLLYTKWRKSCRIVQVAVVDIQQVVTDGGREVHSSQCMMFPVDAGALFASRKEETSQTWSILGFKVFKTVSSMHLHGPSHSQPPHPIPWKNRQWTAAPQSGVLIFCSNPIQPSQLL